MRAKVSELSTPALPHGWRDLVRQLLMVLGAYGAYEIVRGMVGSGGALPFDNANRIIDTERSLHVFVEPNVQQWALTHVHWAVDFANFAYIYAHVWVTAGALLFIYLRRNDSFYFVRNMFLIALLIALVGYAVFPTAPPRLLSEYGFVDTVQQFTHTNAQHGVAGALINPYAAVPSVHVCFALMIGVPMSRLTRSHLAHILWLAYPLMMTFVVIVTANHFLTDAALGAMTAAAAAATSKLLLAPARPERWAFAGLASPPEVA